MIVKYKSYYNYTKMKQYYEELDYITKDKVIVEKTELNYNQDEEHEMHNYMLN